MVQNKRSAMVDACRSGIEDYLGKPLTDEDWFCIMESIYDDAVRSFFCMIEKLPENRRE